MPDSLMKIDGEKIYGEINKIPSRDQPTHEYTF